MQIQQAQNINFVDLFLSKYEEMIGKNHSELEKEQNNKIIHELISSEENKGGEEYLLEVIKEIIPNNENEIESNSTLILIISFSALRCIDIINTIKNNDEKSCFNILKLFSKHIKIHEHQERLNYEEKKKKYHIIVGTPSRVLKLCELNSLNLNSTKLILFDMFSNEKLFNVITMSDTSKDVYNFFYNYVVLGSRNKSLKISFF